MPDAKTGPVPELRFPEFRDAGRWEVKRLGEIADVVAAGDLDKDDFSSEKSVSHRYPIFSNSVVDRGLYGFCSNPSYEKDAVTITARGTLGVAFHREICFSAIGRLLVVSNLNSVDPYFFQENWNFAVNLPLEDGGIPQLPAVKVKATKLTLPSLPEQQKIADCLSSLDDLIRAEGERLAALKAHKTGLMQRLFPRPGETTPRLRFPEFGDAGPWEVMRLGDKGISRFIRDRVAADDVPLGHYVSTVNLLPDFAGLSPEPEKPPAGSAVAYGEGDILMSNIRPYLRKVWVADRSGGASNDVLVARPGKSVVRAFLGQLLMSDRFISHVMEGAKGVKMPRGDLEQIQDFEVPLPARPEQQKIADCLTALDDLIRAQGETIEALKTHKKGLMQKLFPREVG